MNVQNASTNNKRIAKNTLMLYFRMLLIMGVTLYTSRIVLEQLGVIDYGIYNIVGGIVVVLSFLNGAMTQSTQRFLSFELGQLNSDKLELIFKNALLVHLIIGIVIVLLSETIGLWFLKNKINIPFNREHDAFWVYQFSVISLFITILQVPFMAAIVASEKFKFYSLFGIIECLGKLFVACSLSAFNDSNRLFMYSLLMTITYVIYSASYITYCLYRIWYSKICLYFEKTIFVSLIGFAGWNTMGHLVSVLKNQGFGIVLNLFFGPVLNAAFGINNQVINAVSSFNQNFLTTINPQLIKAYSSEEWSRFKSLLFRGCKCSFFLILIISFPVLTNTKLILGIFS